MVSNNLATVRTGYDRWAALYDHDGNPLQALEGPVFRAAVGEVRRWRGSFVDAAGEIAREQTEA